LVGRRVVVVHILNHSGVVPLVKREMKLRRFQGPTHTREPLASNEPTGQKGASLSRSIRKSVAKQAGGETAAEIWIE
jgi:hypothetical protein